MSIRRYTVVPFLLLIAFVFVASQLGVSQTPGQASAAMARAEAR